MAVYQENNGGDAPAQMFVSVDPDGLGPQGFGPQINLGTTNVGSFDHITPQPDRSIDAEMNIAWDRSGGSHNGRVYLVYTDEIPDESNDTDIFLRYSDDSGKTWSAEQRINDDPVGNGKAQFFSAIAVDQSTGDVAITWLDARNSPGNNKVQTWGTVSQDGGVTWEPNVQISAGTNDGLVDGFNFGDYDRMDFVNGVFYRSWADNSNSTGDNPAGAGGNFDIYSAKVAVTGGGVSSITLNATPNPVGENQLLVLDGSFVDSQGNFKSHTVKVDWGDGAAVQQLILSAGVTHFKMNHNFLDNGKFTVQTTITASGFNISDKLDVVVNNLNPTATIIGAPLSIQNEGKPISMGVKVTDPSPLDTFTYLWTVQKNGVVFTTSSSPGLTFTPDDQGNYLISVAVTDDDGGSAQASAVAVSVQNVAPSATALINDGPKMTTQAVTISFVNPTDAGTDLAAGLTYDYDFNNDGTWDLLGSTSSSAQHIYGINGFFTAAARIHDKDGATSPTYFTDIVVSDVGGGNGGVITNGLVAVGSDAGKASVVQVYDKFGTNLYSLSPFPLTFVGGVRVATGDVNGDHVDDIIAVNGAGLSATIKVYDGATGSELSLLSNLYTQQASSAFPLSFKSGLVVASGDIDRDGYSDVVIGPSSGAMPVQVISGKDGTQLAKMFPFGTSYTRGVSLGVGDVTGDRVPDLVVGQAAGTSTVAVFSGTNLTGPAVKTFTAFPTLFSGGVTVAVGDTDGDRRGHCGGHERTVHLRLARACNQRGDLRRHEGFCAVPRLSQRRARGGRGSGW